MAAGDRALERQRRHQMRRVDRAPARQRVDELEVGEGHQHRKGHHHRDDRRQQRQRDKAEPLPGSRAVERRRLVERGRNRLQSREQGDGDEGYAAPDVRHDHGEARVPGLAEKVDVMVDDSELDQRPGDDRELRIVDPPEGDRRKHGGHDERQQNDRAQQRFERQPPVQQQGEIEAEKKLEETRDDGVE